MSKVKTPTVIQMEAVECGAAALTIVMGYYGKFIPLEEARVACGVSRNGSKASHMLQAARQYDFEAAGFKKKISDLVELKPPFIVFWKMNHFIVVEGFTKQYVWINDPALGRKKLPKKEFSAGFTGIALVCRPSEAFKKQGKPKSVFKVLRSRLLKVHHPLAYLFLLGVVMIIPSLLVPIYAKVFVDQYLISGMNEWVPGLLWCMALTMAVMFLCQMLKSMYLVKLKSKLTVIYSSSFMLKILSLPILFFMQRSHADLVQRVGFNKNVAQVLSYTLIASMIDFIIVIAYGYLMFLYNVTMAASVVLIALLGALINLWIAAQKKSQSQVSAMCQSKFYSKCVSGVQAIDTLKSCSRESDYFSEWGGTQANALNASQTIARYFYSLNILPSMLSALGSAVILGLGAIQVIHGAMSVGVLVAFQAMMGGFLHPINHILSSIGSVQQMMGAVARLDDVMLHAKEDKEDGVGSNIKATTTETTRQRSINRVDRLVATDLVFGYDPLTSPCLNQFSLELSVGKMVALVGPSGCGKSTVAKLLMGVFTPRSGVITINGHPLADISRASLCFHVAMVDQTIHLFTGTFRENITLWNQAVDSRDYCRAAKDACVDDVIMASSNGYETPLAHQGSELSGGQQQRIEIARALCVNPDILIMDEATSSLDPVTEKQVYQNIRRRGCGMLVVAHRLSSIRDADQIIVLDQGKIVQVGRHEALIKQSGMYQSLMV